MRILVLGAGVIGVASAYWLAQAGHEVTVLEKRAAAGMETSWGNGGILHVSSVEPWAAPGVPLKVLRWIGDENAPILLRMGALPHMWRWGAAFLRNCTATAHRRNALANLQLALESVAAMGEMREATKVGYDYATNAILKIYPTKEQLDHAAATFRALAPHGLESEVWDRQTCLSREPALAPSAHLVAGGLFFPQDEIGDCNKFSQGVAGWCQARGVVFHYGTEVHGLDIAQGKVVAVRSSAGRMPADAVVVALGSHSPLLLKPVGVDIPIYPVKGVSLTAPRLAWPDAPRMALMDDARKVAYVPIGDRLRVVGSAEITGYDTQPDPRRIAAIADKLCELLPGFRACVEHPEAQPWAGLRPVVPSGQPLIGPTRIGGLWLNTGHGHTGWTMAAGSGKRLAARLSASRALPPQTAGAVR